MPISQTFAVLIKTLLLPVARFIAIVAVGWALARYFKFASKRQIIAADVRLRPFEILNATLIFGFDILCATSFGFLGLIKYKTAAASFGSVAIWISALTIWYEIFFYYSHRCLHLPAFFWIHRRHHEHEIPNAWTSARFSFLERLILLAGILIPVAVVSHWVEIPLHAFLGWSFLNAALTTLIHLNVEPFKDGYESTPLGRVTSTPTHHLLHHLRSSGHYGLFTRVLDRLHGTEFSDYQICSSRHQRSRYPL